MLVLTELGADIFIKKSKSEKLESYWDSYDLVIWKENPAGYSSKNGIFRKNTWGLTEKFCITNNGTWKLPKKYVKHFK